MNSTPTTSISIRISTEWWQYLQKMVEKGEFSNISHAIRSFLELGKWLHDNKERFKDEEEIRKIEQEWFSQMNERANLEWLQDLTDTQIEGVKMAINLETERRYKK